MSQIENAYALIIGVDYKQKTESVLKDAQSIYNLLSNEKLCGYKKDNISLLLDDKATMKGILDELDDIVAKTDENSSFLLYYSGHGGYEQGISYLCPHDKIISNSNYVSGQEIRDRLSKMKSKRIFILFDCCHSGSFFDGKDDIISQTISENTKKQIVHKDSTLEGLAQEIDDERGMVILASSQASELSWGDENDSVFTTCLMEAFKATHKHFFADEYVRTVETVNYVFERTPELIEKLKERSDIVKDQTPYANLQMSSDFAICYIPEEKREKIVTNKFKTQVEKTETVISKGDSTESWEREEGNNLLLFVHGLSGESKGTFGNIPKMLQSDSNFDGWAMKPLGYSPIVQPKLGKDIWGAIRDIDKISGFLKTSIKYKFKDYDRIAIVAHSLGGLVVQKAILGLNDDNRNRISHLIMFGTPSNGISPELLAKQWNSKYSEMSSEGNFIATLRKDWKEAFEKDLPFKLKVAAATGDEYVSVESCHGPFNKNNCEFVDSDHLRMVKPKDENDDAYNLILDTLTGNEFSNNYTNKEEINIILGKYDAVIKNLMPKAKENDLDDRGLRQLVFSLEGLDRKDEAIKMLNDQLPFVKKKSDFLGILGGRYKRAYLKSGSKKDGETSFEYYGKALKLAEEANNNSQIYYHAINLAFLSIVIDGDEDEMEKYANQALEAANKCRDNAWKYGTVAEASMYLDDMEKAKEFYTKAADMSDIRGKISMHTNAYAGYTSLMQTDNPEDDFIKFLKSRLLS